MRYFAFLITFFMTMFLVSGCQEETAPTKQTASPAVKESPKEVSEQSNVESAKVMEHVKDEAHKSMEHAETMEHVKDEAHKSMEHAETMEHVKDEAHKSMEEAQTETQENR